MGKKKRPGTSSNSCAADDANNGVGTLPSNGDESSSKPLVFKNPNFVQSSKLSTTSNKKPRYWKNLKQIIATERTLIWPENSAHYSSIEAPPSFKPAKKYSDLSGLLASYKDPHTKLRYANSDEYSRLRCLPADIVSGYLALRKANVPVP